MNKKHGLLSVLAILSVAGCGHPAEPAGQHEVTAPGELLTTDGRLREPGWSKKQLQRWDPTRVHDLKRLRQWDFFTLQNDTIAVNITLVDLGFARLGSVSVVDLATSEKHETSVFNGASADSFQLSAALEGTATFSSPDQPTPYLKFVTTSDASTVALDIPASVLGEAAKASITIHRRPTMPYLSLATPFVDDPHFFFFEQKIPGMSAEGTLTLGARSYTFAAATTSAVMDWGRGEWPSTVTWRWAAASGTIDGAAVALNLGDGFGDASAGTENLVVVGDVAHKLGPVDWTHDAEDPTLDWTLKSRDGRLSLVLHPTAKEIGGLDLGTRYEHLRKGYGRFTGTIVLDDGKTLKVEGLPGFAEEMNLAW